jgi:putative ABC transport system permease protein
MNLALTIKEALESLAANKMRSGLTILGIVIGVAAVIAMISIGRGAENTISSSIQDIGTNLIFVLRNSSRDIRNPQALTLRDAEALADPFQAPSVQGVAPILQGRVTVTYGGESTTTTLEAVTPDYSFVRNLGVVEGDFIRQEHILGKSAVVLLGPDTAEKLFGRREALVGETVRLEGQPFRVLGILEAKGGSGFANEDDRVIVPLTTAQDRLLRRSVRDQVDMIMVSAVGPESVPRASDEIANILRARHRTQIGADDFTIMTQQDILDISGVITGVLTIFLGGIAAISLLVGGIGIMNIMLVSVIERTREIGLRKALGASRADILVQFLTESAVLSLFGGVLGIGLAWIISSVVGWIANANNAPIDPVIGLDTVLLATLFSAFVGLFFGIYPANRAAALEPVEALRYE